METFYHSLFAVVHIILNRHADNFEIEPINGSVRLNPRMGIERKIGERRTSILAEFLRSGAVFCFGEEGGVSLE